MIIITDKTTIYFSVGGCFTYGGNVWYDGYYGKRACI